MKDRLRLIKEMLDQAFDPEAMDYDTQGVNQAHRIAAGGEPPRHTLDSVARDNDWLNGGEE